jgi:SEC-C motif
MGMVQLNDLLSSDQWESNWTFFGIDHEGLPNDARYVIFEYYCDNATCDCNNLYVDIFQLDDNGEPMKEPLAVVKYDWSSKATQCYPTLDEESSQSEISPYLIKVYEKFIHQEEYLLRIQKQYAHVKKIMCERQINNLTNKIGSLIDVGRNDPCPCGSSKKYKKCCLVG